MGRAKVKFEIEDKGDHFVIFRGKQRTIMTAMSWDRDVTELICATLNNIETAATNRQQLKAEIASVLQTAIGFLKLGARKNFVLKAVLEELRQLSAI